MRPTEAVILIEGRQAAADGRARALRLAARLTQEEVGEVCGVDGPTVSRWECGQRRPRGEPGLRYAKLLATLEKQQSGRAS